MTSNNWSSSDSIALLDDEGYPSQSLIGKRSWATAIVPDFPSAKLIAALCELGESVGMREVLTVSINGSEVDDTALLDSASAVMQFLVNHSYATVLLSVGPSLHLFKDSSSRFSICYGEPGLVGAAYAPANGADAAFLGWLDDARFNSQELSTLRAKFHTYRAGR